MNNASLIGRLTKDPELRFTQTQLAVTTFTIAIDRRVSAGAKEKTDFIRIKVFGREAENCNRYLSKGRLVGIHGRIQSDSYQNDKGFTVYIIEVVADMVDFIDSKPKEEKQDDSLDDIPF